VAKHAIPADVQAVGGLIENKQQTGKGSLAGNYPALRKEE
jgi:hypothetical protein